MNYHDSIHRFDRSAWFRHILWENVLRDTPNQETATRREGRAAIRSEGASTYMMASYLGGKRVSSPKGWMRSEIARPLCLILLVGLCLPPAAGLQSLPENTGASCRAAGQFLDVSEATCKACGANQEVVPSGKALVRPVCVPLRCLRPPLHHPSLGLGCQCAPGFRLANDTNTDEGIDIPISCVACASVGFVV